MAAAPVHLLGNTNLRNLLIFLWNLTLKCSRLTVILLVFFLPRPPANLLLLAQLRLSWPFIRPFQPRARMQDCRVGLLFLLLPQWTPFCSFAELHLTNWRYLRYPNTVTSLAISFRIVSNLPSCLFENQIFHLYFFFHLPWSLEPLHISKFILNRLMCTHDWLLILPFPGECECGSWSRRSLENWLHGDATEKRESRRASSERIELATGRGVRISCFLAMARINEGGEQLTPFTTSFFSGVVRFETAWSPVLLNQVSEIHQILKMHIVFSHIAHTTHVMASWVEKRDLGVGECKCGLLYVAAANVADELEGCGLETASPGDKLLGTPALIWLELTFWWRIVAESERHFPINWVGLVDLIDWSCANRDLKFSSLLSSGRLDTGALFKVGAI